MWSDNTSNLVPNPQGPFSKKKYGISNKNGLKMTNFSTIVQQVFHTCIILKRNIWKSTISKQTIYTSHITSIENRS